MEADRLEKARCHKSDMYVTGESDSSIVPENPANKGSVPLPAESAEGRELTKENTEPSLLDRTQRRNSDGTPFVPRSRGLPGVREAAQKERTLKFTSLLHHMTPELLRASFFALKKQAAPGIDGETWRDDAKDFEARIVDLHGRIHRGAYRAKPSKRMYIPNSMDGCDRWESPPWRTKSSNRRRARFWNASMNRIFWDSVTAFVRDAAVTKPWTPCLWGSRSGK
jgi:hypothetical protein